MQAYILIINIPPTTMGNTYQQLFQNYNHQGTFSSYRHIGNTAEMLKLTHLRAVNQPLLLSSLAQLYEHQIK